MNSSKHIWQKILVNNYSYAILRPFVYIADRLKASRKNYIEKEQVQALQTKADLIFNTGTVLHGPFVGVQLTGSGTGASSNYAKRLGSYEKELHPWFEQLLKMKFDVVINIGSDDGYYALGMAKKNPSARVIAYDTNPTARLLIQKNAELNQISTLQIKAGYSQENLRNHNPNLRSLFIVDCEGGEKEIFTMDNCHALVHADLVIELHLHIHPELIAYFKSIFSSTHDIDIVDYIPDHRKAMEYDYPELKGLSYTERRAIVEERTEFTQWIWLQAKNVSNA